MATTGVFNGKALGLYIGGTLAGCATSATINVNGEEIDVTCKDDGVWGNFLDGTKTWEMSLEGFVAYDTSGYSSEDFFDALIAGTELTAMWSTESAGDVTYSGTVKVLSWEESAANNEGVTYSVSLKGKGAITKGTVSA